MESHLIWRSVRLVVPTIAAVLSTGAVFTFAQEIFSDGFETGTTDRWTNSTTFSPADVDGLWGWWDARNGVTVQDGWVSQWNDGSGNGRDWIQDTESNRPKYIPVFHADQPAIEWPQDNNAWLEMTDHLNPSESDIEIFVVGRTTPDLEWATIVQQLDGEGTGRAWLYFAGYGLSNYIGGAPLTANDVVDVFDVNIYHTSFEMNAQRVELFKNGTSVAVASGVVAESCEGNLALGRSKTENFIEGFIHEVLIYENVLTTAQRAEVVSYLQHKWQTTWQPHTSLPTEIEDLWGWWRADAGITIGLGGISHWGDQSGNGVTLRQSIFERRPQLVANEQNGLPGIQFDIDDDQLENLNDTIDVSVEDATIFVVVNTQNPRACVIAGLDGPTGVGRAWFENEPGTGSVYIGGFPDPPLSLDGGGVFGLSILTVYYNRAKEISQYGVNGWIWGVATNVIGEPNPDGGIRVGNGKYDVNELDGFVFEIVIFNRALSWAERKKVVNYLNGRWAVF